MNKLSRKDIAMLEVLAVTEESKGKLAEYVQQREKAVKAYKAFREAVVNGVEVEKVVKPAKPKRKFKVGDKVRVLDVSFAMATSALDVGDITKVVGYKEDFEEYELLAPKERPVVVAEPEGETGLFEESALELVVAKPTKPKRKFKAGDKVRVLDTENPIVPLGLGVGDVTEVLKYSLGGVVVVKTPRQAGYAFRESSLELVGEKVSSEQCDKKVRKFKAGDKVRVLRTDDALATAGLKIGDVAEVLKYSFVAVVVLKSPYQTGSAFFSESALELVKEKSPNELRAEIIQRMTDDYNRLACEVLGEGEYEEEKE